VPTGTSFVSATAVSGQNPDGFSYSQAGGTVTGTPTGGVVSAGHQDEFTLVVHAQSSDANGSTITNTANVTTTSPDDNDAINDETSTVNSTVATVADVQVAMTGPTTVTAGTDITYTITTTNKGPSDALAVQTTDSPPANTSLVSFVQDSGSPDGSTLPAGAFQTFTLILHLSLSQTDGTTITNRTDAASTGGTVDPNSNNNTFTLDSQVVNKADLQVTMTGPAIVTAGTDITYTITTTNNGPADAQAVQLTDSPPPNTSLVSFAQNAGVPDGSNLPVGASQTFTLILHLNANQPAGSTITNRTDVASTGGTPDDNEAINDETFSLSSNVVAVADLVVSKSGPATVTAGTDITYTITLTNKGPADAQGVSLTDAVPTGTTFVSATAITGQNPDGFSYAQSGGTVTGTPVGGVVANGNQDEFTLVVHALPSDLQGTTISNTANVTTTSADDDDTVNDETFTVNSNVVAVADLQLTKSGPATVTAGTNLTYTITLTNKGPSDAQGVSLTDAVPSGTTFISAAPVAGQNPDAFSYVQSGGTVTGTPAGGVVVAGHRDEFTLVVHAQSSDANGSTITNTANVSTTTTDDNDAINDETATFKSIVATSADLSVTKTGPTSVILGNNLTYTITLTNKGPSDAQAVSLTDAVPAGATFVSFKPAAGFTRTDTTPVGGTGTIKAADPILAAGASATFIVVVKSNPHDAIGSTIANTATVSSTTSDPVATNNHSTADTLVQSNLKITVHTASPSPVTPGTNLVYTITVSNLSTSTALGVAIRDLLPTNTTFVTSSPFGFSVAGGVLTINVGALAGGASATATVTVFVPSATPFGSTITNTVKAREAAQGAVDLDSNTLVTQVVASVISRRWR
jgi:uncharacterized repeat protein (TIGR01451 family)